MTYIYRRCSKKIWKEIYCLKENHYVSNFMYMNYCAGTLGLRRKLVVSVKNPKRILIPH